MAELADAHGLGPCAERRAGSSPVPGTTGFQSVENMIPEAALLSPSAFLQRAHSQIFSKRKPADPI
jgi:hypothetical protein